MAKRRQLEEVVMDRIRPSKFQARQTFDEEAIKELEASMREDTQSTPVLIRPTGRPSDAQPGDSGPWYELVSGEQRIRAAKNLGLSAIWAVIEDMTDEEAAFRGLVENAQRRDLNVMDRTMFYQRLMDEFHLTQQQLADKLGIAKGTLSRILNLLNEPPEIRELLANGALTERHCRAIAAVQDQKKRVALAKLIAAKGMSVEEAHKRAQRLLAEREGKPGPEQPLGAEYNGFCLHWKGRELVITKRNYKPDGELLKQYLADMASAVEAFLRNEPRAQVCPAKAEVPAVESTPVAPLEQASPEVTSQPIAEIVPDGLPIDPSLLPANAEELWKRAVSAMESAFGVTGEDSKKK